MRGRALAGALALSLLAGSAPAQRITVDPKTGLLVVADDENESSASKAAAPFDGNRAGGRTSKGSLAVHGRSGPKDSPALRPAPPKKPAQAVPSASRKPASTTPSASQKAFEAASGTFATAFRNFQLNTYSVVLPVVTRGEWKARKPEARYAKTIPYRITVHHTEGHLVSDLKAAGEEARTIQQYHQKGREELGLTGFIDIGYHFLVDGEGRVFEGRPLDALGAHADHANSGNVGIALMGDFEKVQPTAAQLESLRRLALFVAMKYEADPNASGFLSGHSRYVATACPGKHLSKELPKVVLDVSRRAATMAAPDGSLVARSR